MKSASRFPRFVALVACLLLAYCATLRAQHPTGDLKIFFIDVEGGQSTLFVTPDHHSLLIDTGWPDYQGRDADRIAAAAKRAGLDHIDYVLLTHYHVDHTGGVPQLVARIPVGTFIDHGPLREPGDKPTADAFAAYQKVLATGKYSHIVAKPGDRLPIPGFPASSSPPTASSSITPLPGAGQPNPFCKDSAPRPADQTENARSLGTLITWGRLRILDLGDLTWDKEMDHDVSHQCHRTHRYPHRLPPRLESKLQPRPRRRHHPRVAIMDNGATKGGSKPTVETIRKIPGLEAEWQLHYSEEAGPDNPPTPSSPTSTAPIPALASNLTASPRGSFSVYNPRTQKTIDYAAH